MTGLLLYGATSHVFIVVAKMVFHILLEPKATFNIYTTLSLTFLHVSFVFMVVFCSLLFSNKPVRQGGLQPLQSKKGIFDFILANKNFFKLQTLHYLFKNRKNIKSISIISIQCNLSMERC